MGRPPSKYAEMLAQFRHHLINEKLISTSTASTYSGHVGAALNKHSKGPEDFAGLNTYLQRQLLSQDRSAKTFFSAWQHFIPFARRHLNIDVPPMPVAPPKAFEAQGNSSVVRETRPAWAPMSAVITIMERMCNVTAQHLVSLTWGALIQTMPRMSSIKAYDQEGYPVIYEFSGSAFDALVELHAWAGGSKLTKMHPMFPVEPLSHQAISRQKFLSYVDAHYATMGGPDGQIPMGERDQEVARARARARLQGQREREEAKKAAAALAKRQRLADWLDLRIKLTMIHNCAEREANIRRSWGETAPAWFAGRAAMKAVGHAGIPHAHFEPDEIEVLKAMAKERAEAGVLGVYEDLLHADPNTQVFPESPEESAEKLRSMGFPVPMPGSSNESNMGSLGATSAPLLVFEDEV